MIRFITPDQVWCYKPQFKSLQI